MRNPASVRLELETLGSRTLPSVTLVHNVVFINGTSADDVAHVAMNGTQVVATLNGQDTSFPLLSVRAVAFYGNSGNDTFTNDTPLFSAAYGGAGNDTLIGGSGSDLLVGGAGNDVLMGRD